MWMVGWETSLTPPGRSCDTIQTNPRALHCAANGCGWIWLLSISFDMWTLKNVGWANRRGCFSLSWCVLGMGGVLGGGEGVHMNNPPPFSHFNWTDRRSEHSVMLQAPLWNVRCFNPPPRTWALDCAAQASLNQVLFAFGTHVVLTFPFSTFSDQ